MKQKSKKSGFNRILGWANRNLEAAVVLCLLGAGVVFYILSFVPTFGENYSEGVGYGYFQKYSCKGIFFKTGEGEVVLKSSDGSAKGEMPVFEVFKFSDKNCGAWDSLVGQPVVVRYTQPYHMSRLDGTSGYQVISIEKNSKKPVQ